MEGDFTDSTYSGVNMCDSKMKTSAQDTLHMSFDENSEEFLELINLCDRNGRDYAFTKDGKLITFDRYDGCDGRISENLQEAIEWEKGYTFLSGIDIEDEKMLIPTECLDQSDHGIHQ